jgi:hypothetical protein
MSDSGAVIRDYKPSDFSAVAKIHEESGIDYKLPDLESPLFLIKQVAEYEGKVVAALGALIQTEFYLWLSKEEWGTPEQKFSVLKELDESVISEVWLKGVDSAVLYLPPNMERFGKRLEKDFGWSTPRPGWKAFSKTTGRK